MQDSQKMLVQTHTPGSNEMLSNVENRWSMELQKCLRYFAGTSTRAIRTRRPLHKDNEVQLNNVDRFGVGLEKRITDKVEALARSLANAQSFPIRGSTALAQCFWERPSAAPDVPP